MPKTHAGKMFRKRSKQYSRRALAAASAIAGILAISACVPMAMFAGGSSKYESNLGVQVSHNNVNTTCMSPALRFAIWKIEGHFLKKIVVNSAYRSPTHNASVGGANNSYHTRCMAVDFFVPDVSKSDLINYVATLDAVGGLGCYSGRSFIHIDVRTRPRGYRKPVTWGC